MQCLSTDQLGFKNQLDTTFIINCLFIETYYFRCLGGCRFLFLICFPKIRKSCILNLPVTLHKAVYIRHHYWASGLYHVFQSLEKLDAKQLHSSSTSPFISKILVQVLHLRRIYNLVKQIRWSFLPKQLKAEIY